MEPSHVFTWRRGIASVELFGGGAYLVEREWIVRCSQRFTRRARVRYGRRIWKEEKARGEGWLTFPPPWVEKTPGFRFRFSIRR